MCRTECTRDTWAPASFVYVLFWRPLARCVVVWYVRGDGRPAGACAVCCAYLVVFENQKRETAHCHCLVWTVRGVLVA